MDLTKNIPSDTCQASVSRSIEPVRWGTEWFRRLVGGGRGGWSTPPTHGLINFVDPDGFLNQF